jgi:hypothetical protein
MRRSALHDAQCMLHAACCVPGRARIVRHARAGARGYVCSVSANPARTHALVCDRVLARVRIHPACPPIRRRLLWSRAFPSLAGTARTARLDGIAAGVPLVPQGVAVREVKTPHFVLSELNRTDETTQCAPTHCGAPHIRAVPCHAAPWRGLLCRAVRCCVTGTGRPCPHVVPRAFSV